MNVKKCRKAIGKFPIVLLALALLASALFVVYPIFIQQASAVTFSDHWICYAFYALSILLMILGVKHRRLLIPFTILALILTGAQLLFMEYFAGLELLRPVILWLFFSRSGLSRKEKAQKTLLNWLPYLLLFGGYIVWRLAFMPIPETNRNAPVVLQALLSNPLSATLDLLIKVLRDVLQALLAAWYPTYRPDSIAVAPVSSLLAWVVAGGAVALALIFCLLKENRPSQLPRTISPIDYHLFALFGLTAMVLGFLPVWVIDRHIATTAAYADRFGLAAMFGASILTVGLTGILFKHKHQLLLISILVGLAAGYQFRIENSYRWSWERQTRLYWQLHWRIPDLQPGTALFGDGVYAQFMGSWVDVATYNLFFTRPTGGEAEDFWYFDLYKANALPANGTSLTAKKMEHMQFEGNSNDSVVIQFKAEPGQCLWVVDQKDEGSPYLDGQIRAALPISNPGRIVSKESDRLFPSAIFGAEPPHTWCYFFEKAQLAEQSQDWASVLALWSDSERGGYHPEVPVEYVPFIRAAMANENIDLALDLTHRSYSIDQGMGGYLCSIWSNFLKDKPAAYSQIRGQIDELGCGINALDSAALPR